MQNESSIKDLINNSLNQIRTIIDADTVVGKQIVTPSGTVIIPISKVSMGFASGGLDLPGQSQNKNFGGGGGTGVSVMPVGFLTVYADGHVEMLPFAQEKATPIEQIADILEHTPDLINRIKNVINGDEEVEVDEDELMQNIEDEVLASLENGEAAESYNEEPALSKKELKEIKKQAKAAKKAEKAEKKAAKKDAVTFVD